MLNLSRRMLISESLELWMPRKTAEDADSHPSKKKTGCQKEVTLGGHYSNLVRCALLTKPPTLMALEPTP